MEATWSYGGRWNDQGKLNEFDFFLNENEYPINHHYNTHFDHIDFAHFDLNHVQLDHNILISFFSLISKLILII